MFVLIDNYDSFSYNLYQMAGSIEPCIRVIRNDACGVKELEGMHPDGIILSPGPGKPKEAGICEEAVKKLRGKIPILGICLGHQAICEALGGTVSYAKQLMHGKQSRVRTDGRCPVFRGLPEEILAARYHSLAVREESLPECLQVAARAEDGEIMGVWNEEELLYGLQFHPESILTPLGNEILKNWFAIVKKYREGRQ